MSQSCVNRPFPLSHPHRLNGENTLKPNGLIHPAFVRESEAQHDALEGMSCLRTVHPVKHSVQAPSFAYQARGDFANHCVTMNTGRPSDSVMLKSLIAFKDAGADGILT